MRISDWSSDVCSSDLHASIVSLLELAPKRLKIDRKLVAPLDVSISQRRLVASIIEIGRSQGIEIVAEGVETMAHAEILRDLGCHDIGRASGRERVCQ